MNHTQPIISSTSELAPSVSRSLGIPERFHCAWTDCPAHVDLSEYAPLPQDWRVRRLRTFFGAAVYQYICPAHISWPVVPDGLELPE